MSTAPAGALAAPTQPITGESKVPDPDEARLDAGIDTLAKLPSGRELAALLRERRDDIVLIDADSDKLPEGAGGAWVATVGKLYLRRDQLDETGWETLLAHEARHMHNAGGLPTTALRSLRSVGRGLLDMAVAPFRLRNPVTAAVDGVRGAFQIDEEADAYHLQAQVANEMHLRADFLQTEDGTPRSEDEIREWLLQDPLYAFPTVGRIAVGAGFAWLLGRAGSQAVNAGIKRLAPQSWLGRHPIAVTGAGLAIGAALLVQDITSHND